MSTRPKLEGSNVLVTGGAGFIGSHLVDGLLDAGARNVVAVDNLFVGRVQNLQSALKRGAVFYREDAEIYSSLGYIIDRHNIDIVYNLATKALNYSFDNPRNAFETNTAVVLNLLEFLREGKIKSLCHFSSSEVYGTAEYVPMDERHPMRPTTTYAAGKAAADMALSSYVQIFGLDAFILRPFNNYGPRQNHEPPLAGIIPLTTKRILEGTPPEIHGTGKQSRDFIFVKDTVDLAIKLFERVEKGDTVNLATEGQISMEELISRIAKEIDYKGTVVRKESRRADVELHHASTNKLRSLIEFQPTSFEDGLRETVAWYRENLN